MSMMSRLAHRSVTGLSRTAAVLALAALAIMSWSLISPRPLPVILAMSVGHLVGASAFGCYLLAVVLDAWRRGPPASRPSGRPPQPERPSDPP
jgi:hypothetical protein